MTTFAAQFRLLPFLFADFAAVLAPCSALGNHAGAGRMRAFLGGGHFTPIVNKPEVAILGLGRGAMKPAVRGDKIEPRLMLPMALSYDHRVIDGGAAARFVAISLTFRRSSFPVPR